MQKFASAETMMIFTHKIIRFCFVLNFETDIFCVKDFFLFCKKNTFFLSNTPVCRSSASENINWPTGTICVPFLRPVYGHYLGVQVFNFYADGIKKDQLSIRQNQFITSSMKALVKKKPQLLHQMRVALPFCCS